MPVWNDKIAGQQAARGQVSVNSAFTWSLLLSNAYQFCSSNVWVLQHHFVHALDMSTIIIFVYLGLQYKWNRLSSNNSRHTSCIHKRLHAGKWPQIYVDRQPGLRGPGTRFYSVLNFRLSWKIKTHHTDNHMSQQYQIGTFVQYVASTPCQMRNMIKKSVDENVKKYHVDFSDNYFPTES